MGFRPLGVWRCLFNLFKGFPLFNSFDTFSIFLPFMLNHKLIAGCMQFHHISPDFLMINKCFCHSEVSWSTWSILCALNRISSICSMKYRSRVEENLNWGMLSVAPSKRLAPAFVPLRLTILAAVCQRTSCGVWGDCVSRHWRHVMRIPSIFQFGKIWKSFPRYCAILLEDQVPCRGSWICDMKEFALTIYRSPKSKVTGCAVGTCLYYADPSPVQNHIFWGSSFHRGPDPRRGEVDRISKAAKCQPSVMEAWLRMFTNVAWIWSKLLFRVLFFGRLTWRIGGIWGEIQYAIYHVAYSSILWRFQIWFGKIL